MSDQKIILEVLSKFVDKVFQQGLKIKPVLNGTIYQVSDVMQCTAIDHSHEDTINDGNAYVLQDIELIKKTFDYFDVRCGYLQEAKKRVKLNENGIFEPKEIQLAGSIELNLNLNFAKFFKFVSNDELRPEMNGIYIDTKKGNAVSTDAHQLIWGKVCEPSEINPFIIKPDLCKILASLKIDKVKIFKTPVSRTFELIFQYKGIHFVVVDNVIDARFPDYFAVIPQNNFYMKTSKKELIDVINSALPYANKGTNCISLFLESDSIRATAKDTDFNRYYEDTIKGICTASHVFGVDGKLLLRALNASDSTEVSISYSDNSSCAIIIEGTNENILVFIRTK